MFGIIYTLISGIAIAGSGIKNSYENAKLDDYSRSLWSTIDPESELGLLNVYSDRTCGIGFKDKTTGAIRYKKEDKYGDMWLADSNGKLLKNGSGMRREVEAAKRAAKAPKGTIAVYYYHWNHTSSRLRGKGLDRVEGDIYKDIKTGELYIKRCIGWGKNMEPYEEAKKCYRIGEFYMKISDGLLKYPADSLIKRMLNAEHGPKVPNSKEVADFMKYFNQKQREGGFYQNNLKINPLMKYFQELRY